MNFTKFFASVFVLCASTVMTAQNLKAIEKEAFAGLSVNGFTGSDVSGADMKMGFHAGVTGRYYFVENGFVEGSLGIATKGYKLKKTSSSGNFWIDDERNYDSERTKKYTSYNIELPILVGYNFTLNNDINLKVKAGPYLTYAISGKMKTTGYETDYDDIHSSSTEYINEETKIGDIDGFKNFSYGIQAGVGADYKQFIVSASYQRGLSKIFDKAKAYEQNILISVGYKF